ncbi:caspase family protein [Vannielia litorea]|uniref:caspase family protein n=1 Tax=Vannielia litorea TaxID=1217970 RepID=UPI001C98A3B3|nr:caspase family protein [Vannielia litorea]MBY6155401.1 caspase family protein [Vannielia litorea]
MRLLVLVILCITALPALAEKRVALVIGNDRYEAMRPLRNAANDADTVGAALEALGFEVAYERDRDKRRMERALEDLEYDGEGADVAVVYFAGHGFEVGGDNRLLPVDGDGESLETLMETSLSLGEIRARVAKIAPVAVVLVDACRVDPFEGATEGRAAIALKAGVTPGFAAVPRAEGTLIGFSTAPGAVALDGEGSNSPFAAALARHLETPGLEVRSVLTLVQQEVYDRTRGAQLPYVESALPRLFFAAGQSDALPERERLLLAMADLTPDLRAEVERVAMDAQVPLAPIYGALLAAGLGDVPQSERESQLEEAARAFGVTRSRLRSLSADDPKVGALRGRALERLELGDFGGAMGLLDEAIALDSASGDTLEANLVSRRLSAAESLAVKADVARTRLDYDTALAALEEARQIHHKLEGLDLPDEGLRGRIQLYSDLGDIYQKLGRSADGRASFARMHEHAAARAEAMVGNSEALRLVALALSRLGRADIVAGDALVARANLEAGIAIAEPLVKGEPESKALLETYSALLGYYGDLLRKQGDLGQAYRIYRVDREVILALQRLDPDEDEPDYTVKFADTYLRTGEIAVAQGVYDMAEIRLDYARGFYAKLVERFPDKLGYRGRLARVWGQIGNARSHQKNHEGAQAAYQAQLDHQDILVQRSPRDAGFRHQYAVSLLKMGDVRFDRGSAEEARALYELAMEMALEAQRQDPDSTVRHHLVAGAYFRLGDVLVETGDRAGGEARFRAGRDVLLGLREQSPDDIGLLTGLMVAAINLGRVEDDPRETYRAGLEIADQLAEHGRLTPYYADLAEHMRSLLAQAEQQHP